MKKILVLSLALALAFIHYAFASGLIKSKHDMENDCKIKGKNQICVYCHNPHNGVDYGSGVEFLRNSGNKNPLADSVICRNCHTNK